MLVLGLLFTAQICFCIVEDQFNTTVEAEVTEKLHEGTPILLLTLGNNLKGQLLHPTSDRNQGKQTIEGLFSYYNNLKDVLDMLKSKDGVDKKLGMKLFRMLIEAGGPPHLEIEFDIEDAMEKYEWNNKAVFTVRKMLDETEALWQDIQFEVDKKILR